MPGLLILFSIALIIVAVYMSVSNVSLQRDLENSRKKHEEELTKLKTDQEQRLKELLQEKQQLLNMMSHDIRGPYNRIFALIQLIQMSADNLLPDQKEYIGKIHIMVADGLSTLRNLMDLQKLETGTLQLNPETFNFAPLLNTLVRNHRVISEKKKIQIQMSMPSTLMLHTDRHVISRVVENLLSNAIKFTSEGKVIYVMAHQGDSFTTIQVRDEGPGLSESDQKLLYQKFVTLSPTPTAGETASGLGLSIAKGLADKAGLELACTSQVGTGSTFLVKVPL